MSGMMCVCVRRAAVWTLLPVFVCRSPSLFPSDDIITSRKRTHPTASSWEPEQGVCVHICQCSRESVYALHYLCTHPGE